MAINQRGLPPTSVNTIETQHSLQRMTSLQPRQTGRSSEKPQPPQRPYHSMPITFQSEQKNFELARRKVCELGISPTETGFGKLVTSVGAAQVGLENESPVGQLIASQTLNPETVEKVRERCKAWNVSLTDRESLINLTAMLLSDKEQNPQAHSFLDTA